MFKSENTGLLILAVVMVLVGYFMIAHAAAQDRAMEKFNDCVARQVMKEGHHESPHSEETWIKYEAVCANTIR